MAARSQFEARGDERRSLLMAGPTRSSARRNAALSILGGLVLWQAGFDLFVRESLFLASPVQILRAYRELAGSGELLHHVAASAREFFLGYLLAVAVGIPVGFVMATSRRMNQLFDPWIAALYSTPRLALAPLTLIWFGIGTFFRALIVFLGAVFPIIFNTYTGIRGVREGLIELVRSLGGTRLQIFTKVMLPEATPALIGGLRLAVERGVIGVVVAEWFGASTGLGYLIYHAAQTFDPATVFAGIILLVALGWAMFALLGWVQLRVAPWYGRAERERGAVF
jgi:NitT/TauT family transport system permease protein